MDLHVHISPYTTAESVRVLELWNLLLKKLKYAFSIITEPFT